LRLIRLQADFVEIAILPISVSDGAFAGAGATEDRNLNPALFVLALDAPITWRYLIREDFGAQVVVGIPAPSFSLNGSTGRAASGQNLTLGTRQLRLESDP
jgi:hypothetical protein